MRTKNQQIAYDKGCRAAAEGDERGDNPYRINTVFERHWFEGWKATKECLDTIENAGKQMRAVIKALAKHFPPKES